MFGSKKDNSIKKRHHFAENLGITVEVPEGWGISENQFFALFIAAPAEERYRANIGFNVGTIETPTLEGMGQLFEEAEKQQSQSQQNYKLISSDRLDIDERPALLRQTQRHEPNSGSDLTQLQALIFAQEDAVYNVSATSLTSLASKYIPLLKDILTSVKFSDEGE